MNPAIRLVNVKKSFHSNHVLKNITLDIHEGEIFGIIGSSGGGKTTLLNTMIGFLNPDSGQVLFKDGKQFIPVKDNHVTIKKRFGFAAQRPSVYEKLTVFENLDYFGALYNLGREARLTNINTLLDLVELSAARDIQAKNLSGGMLRRLDIACALIHDPGVLILDEPTSDLDPLLAGHIWDLLKKINKRGTTVIVSSHHLTEIENICSRIAILSDGTVEHVGTVNELTAMLSKGQEINIETYPGNYAAIMKKLKDPVIKEMEQRGSVLTIRTSKPEKVMLKLLQMLGDVDENLMDASITRLSLSDVFSQIKNENSKNH